MHAASQPGSHLTTLRAQKQQEFDADVEAFGSAEYIEYMQKAMDLHAPILPHKL
jgi:hypothetical protein